MKITRTTNPDISIHLIPWYVEDDQTALEIGMELNDRMTENPDDTCVLVATDKGYMKAMAVAYIEGDRMIIWQGKKSKDMSNPRLMFHELYKWGRGRGAEKAVLGSPDKRVRRLYKRKYGYKPTTGGWMEKML
jgi:hypothetical protein